MDIDRDEAQARGKYLSKAARAQGRTLSGWTVASIARWLPVEPAGINFWSVDTDNGPSHRLVALVDNFLLLASWNEAKSKRRSVSYRPGR